MNTILKYGVILSYGSVLGLTASWASEEQKTPREAVERATSQPTFVSIGKVKVPKEALPVETLRALQEQQDRAAAIIAEKDVEIQRLVRQNSVLTGKQEAVEELRTTIQEKKEWIVKEQYLDSECLKKCSPGDIVMIHGFALQTDALRKKINQLRLENDLLIKQQQHAVKEYSDCVNKIRPLEDKINELVQREKQSQEEIEFLKAECKRLKIDRDIAYREMAHAALT